MVDRDRRTLAEIGRIEITCVTGGIENQASETTSRDRGDVGDVIDPAEQLDREIRIVYLDGEGAVGDASQRSVERQRRRRQHRAVEGRRTGETDLIAQVLARADDELAAGRDIERADADQAAHDPEDTGGRGGRIAAKQQAAGAQVEVPRKRVLGAQLQDAVARLGDGGSSSADDRCDTEGRVDRGISRSADGDRRHRDGVDPRSKGERTSGEGGNVKRVRRGSRNRTAAAKGQGARDGQGWIGVTPVIIESDAIEGLADGGGESQVGSAVHRQVRGGRDGVARAEVDRDAGPLESALDGQAAGGDNHHGSVSDGRADIQRASIDDRAAAVGIGGGQRGRRGTILDVLGAGALDHRVDREGAGMIIGDELTAAAGQHATDGGGSNRRIEGFVAAQQASELEIEHVSRGREGDVVGESSGKTQDGGVGRAGRQGSRGGDQGGNLPKHPRSGRAVVADEAALPHDADPEARIVGGVIGLVGDGPSAYHTTIRSRNRRGEDDAGRVAKLAEVGPCEIDGGIVLPGEGCEGEVDGSHRAAARRGGNRVRALLERNSAEGLGGRRGNTAGVADATPS